MKTIALCILFGSIFVSACVPHTIQVEPLQVEPIHMTVDLTIHSKADTAKSGEAPSDASRAGKSD